MLQRLKQTLQWLDGLLLCISASSSHWKMQKKNQNCQLQRTVKLAEFFLPVTKWCRVWKRWNGQNFSKIFQKNVSKRDRQSGVREILILVTLITPMKKFSVHHFQGIHSWDSFKCFLTSPSTLSHPELYGSLSGGHTPSLLHLSPQEKGSLSSSGTLTFFYGFFSWTCVYQGYSLKLDFIEAKPRNYKRKCHPSCSLSRHKDEYS